MNRPTLTAITLHAFMSSKVPNAACPYCEQTYCTNGERAAEIWNAHYKIYCARLK